MGGLAPVDPGRVPDEALLERMAAAMGHRAPFASVRRGPGIGLVARGARPGAGVGTTDDGRVVAVVDGAILNSPELARELRARGHGVEDDDEARLVALLHRERGPGFLDFLRGPFALAVWDGTARELLLARDRLGERPLVYAETPAGLAFASECKPILAIDGPPESLDPAAIDCLFRFGYVISPRTIFPGLRTLLPGHRLRWSRGRARVERWWDVPFPAEPGPVPRRSDREWIEGLRERIDDAVAVHARSHGPVTSWLSGGLDSSLLTALLARSSEGELDVSTLAFEDPDYDETAAGTLAERAGLRLQVRRATLGDADFESYRRALWHVEAPSTSGVEVSWWVLARAAREGPDTVMSGQGADAVFAGTWLHRIEWWSRPLARLPLGWRRRLATGPLSPRRRPWGAGALLAPAGPPFERYEALAGLRDRESRERLFSRGFRERVAEARRHGPRPIDAIGDALPADPSDRIQYVKLKTQTPDFAILKLERTAMAHGLQIRLPFLDRDVVEYVARVPASVRLRGRNGKWLLREAARGRVPESIRKRPKRGLSAPYARWLREPLPEPLAALMSDDALLSSGYFDPAEVARRLERHRSGVEDAAESLLGVLAVQTMDEAFVRARRAPGEDPPS